MPQPLELSALAVVIACWIAFAGFFWFGKRKATGGTAGGDKERRRDPISWIGIGLQGVAFGACWALQRTGLGPFLPVQGAARVALAVADMALAIGSTWLAISAARTLGKQWSLAARVLEGHRLVTEGPYARVRNPIYSSMLGMLVATGMAVSAWPVLLVACAVFALGTYVRIRTEERLLREQFGEEFDAYARRVKALVPGIW